MRTMNVWTCNHWSCWPAHICVEEIGRYNFLFVFLLWCRFGWVCVISWRFGVSSCSNDSFWTVFSLTKANRSHVTCGSSVFSSSPAPDDDLCPLVSVSSLKFQCFLFCFVFMLVLWLHICSISCPIISTLLYLSPSAPSFILGHIICSTAVVVGLQVCLKKSTWQLKLTLQTPASGSYQSSSHIFTLASCLANNSLQNDAIGFTKN